MEGKIDNTALLIKVMGNMMGSQIRELIKYMERSKGNNDPSQALLKTAMHARIVQYLNIVGAGYNYNEFLDEFGNVLLNLHLQVRGEKTIDDKLTEGEKISLTKLLSGTHRDYNTRKYLILYDEWKANKLPGEIKSV